MAFRLMNPAWKSAAQLKAEQHAAAVQAWLNSNSASRYVTLADLRAGLPAIAPDLTRQVVNIIAGMVGAGVDGIDDAGA